jgi:hypothetical protein
MRVRKSDWVTLVYVLYIGLATLLLSYLIGFATQYDVLLLAAVPLGFIFIATFFWLPARIQLAAWAVASAWLLSGVYLGSSDFEVVVLIVVCLMALAGVLWSPWFLVVLWFVHPLWDLIPRDLPEHQHDLPLACLIYDLIVAVYLLWRTRKGFFADAVATPAKPTKYLNSGAARMGIAGIVAFILIAEILIVGSLTMDPLSPAYSWAAAVFLILTTFWLPVPTQRLFWAAFTMWTGMNFAHSGDLLEIIVFFAMIALAILGYRVSIYFWVIAWSFHGLWNFLPREHDMASAMLMGHWMIPLAGAIFELVIAVYLFTRRKTLAPQTALK